MVRTAYPVCLIEKQLKNESGIRRIDVDYMTDNVVVEFDPSIITKGKIKDRLEKSGYNFVRTVHQSSKHSFHIRE